MAASLAVFGRKDNEIVRIFQKNLGISAKSSIFVPKFNSQMNIHKSILTFAVGFSCFLLLPARALSQNFQNQSNVQWSAVPSHGDWLYKTGEKATIDVTLLMHGMPVSGVEISYQSGGDCLSTETQNKVTTDAHGKATLNVGTRRAPGFCDTQMQCNIEGHTYKNHLKVGFDPENIMPYTQQPRDFDAYWSQVLADQERLPLEVETWDAPEFDTPNVICQKVKIRCYRKDGQHYIYGYLTRPRKAGKYPVVVSPPGAGVKPMDPRKTMFYAEKGQMIRLDLEIHGIDPALDAATYSDITRAFGDHFANGYLSNGLQSRETYYMRKVYAAMVRAVDYLTTLPDWDGKNILVQGNSQGAALSLVLAGLDKRITAVACAHPALSDMAGYAEKGRTGGYPHFGNRYKDVKLTPQVIETLSYYDVVNFARRISCPVYMTWGYNDNTCPPTTSWAVWNVLSCPKEKYITPINEHWISTETRYRQMEFLKKNMLP